MGVNLENINLGLNRVADITEKLKNVSHFENVPVKYIRTASNNPYKENDSEQTISELADSIEANGLIHPLCVNQVSATEYVIISGERRFTAIIKYLHWVTIPCNVYDDLSENEAELKLHLANLEAREYSSAQKLKFYEAVEKLIQNMIDTGEYSGSKQKAVSKVLNVSTRQVRKYKSITEKLNDEQKQKIYDGELSINAAAAQVQNQAEPVPLENDFSDKSELSSSFEDVTIDKTEPVPLENNVKEIIAKTQIAKCMRILDNVKESEIFDDVDRDEIENVINSIEVLFNKYFGEAK